MRIILLATSLLLLFGACSEPQNPTFNNIKNVKFNSLSIKKPYSVTLNADAEFNNPNAIGAEISAMDFDVFINGIKTTHVTQDVSAKVSAQSDFTLPIICKIPLEDIFKELKLTDVLKSPQIEYEMIGHITVNFAGVDIEVPFNYEGVERLRL